MWAMSIAHGAGPVLAFLLVQHGDSFPTKANPPRGGGAKRRIRHRPDGRASEGRAIGLAWEKVVFRHEREIILLETRPILNRSMQARFGLARRALICLLSLGLILGSLLAAAAPSEGQAWTATWTQKSDASPGPRAPVDMTFDTVQSRAILFGGTASVPLNDVWQYDTAADRWLQIQPAVACPSDPAQPTGRFESSLGYDPFNQLVWIFGGVGVGCSGSTRTAGKGSTTTTILDQSLTATALDFYKGWSVTVGNGSTTVTAYDPAIKMLTLAVPLSGARRWTSYLL